jgi:hypothetical protein
MNVTKDNTKLNFHAVRLSASESDDLAAIIAAMTNPDTRPNVSYSDAFRAALRIAARALKTPTAGAVPA